MKPFLPTIIFRHQKENKKKCSLKGLEKRKDFVFYNYPRESYPDLSQYVVLGFEGPVLTQADAQFGLCLFDGTWRYVKKMFQEIPAMHYRTLPQEIRTAYPRRQTDCEDPVRGLSSLEALYIAYYQLKRKDPSLLDNYFWKNEFLGKNAQYFF